MTRVAKLVNMDFLLYELDSGKLASLTKESNMHTYFSLITAKINLLNC